MRSGRLWCRIYCCAARTLRSGSTLCVPSSTAYGTWYGTGCQWRYLPHDLPPWPVVYQQTQRWIESHCFETMVEDLRLLLREFSGRKAQPTAMLLDSRTIPSPPESGARAGYDGAKRRKGSKVHAAVDTLS